MPKGKVAPAQKGFLGSIENDAIMLVIDQVKSKAQLYDPADTDYSTNPYANNKVYEIIDGQLKEHDYKDATGYYFW